ncbi:MAG: nucleotidyltransferase domain-containing protein [Cyanobacteria bacterium P01_D01_bin.73]
MTQSPPSPTVNLQWLSQKLGQEITRDDLGAIAQHWQLTELSLFGSVLRDDFHAQSDVDVIIQFHPAAKPTFATLDRIQVDLETLFKRPVDVITRNGISNSRNYLRREAILSSAKLLHGTRSTISA